MNKKQNKNKRAFTLTELLIVVIVIGVLSAVTLPKFTRVIENRKVTEAEEIMSAVRTEQERRCAMDKNYTLKFDNLSDVVSSSNTKNYNTKNYTYSLQDEGISAQSKKGNYTLKMLSYQDGSLCCSGADCAKLNKNYPSCDGLTFPPSGCEGNDGDGSGVGTDPTPIPEPTPTPDCTDGQVRGSQSCNGCGTQTTQACVGGKWEDRLGACSKTAAECETRGCTTSQPAAFISPCGSCMEQTISYTCKETSAGVWNWVSVPLGCHFKAGMNCTGGTETQACTKNGRQGTQTRTCSSCVWSNWSECKVKECEHGVREDGTCKELVMKYRITSNGIMDIPACRASEFPTMTSQDCRKGRCPGSGNTTITVPTGSFDDTCNADTGPGHHFTKVDSVKKKVYQGEDWWFCNFVIMACVRDWEVYL